MRTPIRVGIVGANAHRGWARDAHWPALKHLPRYDVHAVSARTLEVAEEARVLFGAARAFGDSCALAQDPEIDLVVVAVKAPEHRQVVLAALEAGKHVYCEWPLGRDLAEAEEMAAAVTPASRVMVGLQGLASPAIREAARLVREGRIGAPRVMRASAPTGGWGAEAPPHYAYLQDKRNGATLETIAGGHALAVIEHIVGPYAEVDARNSTLCKRVLVTGVGEVDRTCADHMLVLGVHANACVSTLEVAGGAPAAPVLFEIIGETGWLRLSAPRAGGGFQVGKLSLETSFSGVTSPIAALSGPMAHVSEAYVAFAEAIEAGASVRPDFDDAVRLTRLLDCIDQASETGRRQSVPA